jgi:DNA replication protein DnaC
MEDKTMLNNQTIEKLKGLKLTGMLKALDEQMSMPAISELDFWERLALMVDREILERENRRLKTRLKSAKLRQSASIEDIDYRSSRGIDRGFMASLASCGWVGSKNVIITGATGVGKTYVACALAQKAMREGFGAIYKRTPRLVRELALAKGDGSYPRILNSLARTDLLVLDDWGITAFTGDQDRDLLEIVEDRHGLKSTIITSQVPVDSWHSLMTNPTVADAILDRLVHNAYRINLTGESMRRVRAKIGEPDE